MKILKLREQNRSELLGDLKERKGNSSEGREEIQLAKKPSYSHLHKETQNKFLWPGSSHAN